MLILAVAMVAAYVPVVESVYVNGRGPYKFLVDTGAESSVLSPDMAREAGLEPAYRVEIVTATGLQLVPAAEASVSVGGTTHRAEVLIYEPPVSGVDGVLGQNMLARSSYLIDYRNRRVVIGESTVDGARLPLRFAEGRPVVDTDPLGELVLDSGASNVVLFRHMDQVRANGSGTLQTAQGQREVATGHLKCLQVGDANLRDLTVAVAPGVSGIGLLPASLFASVYVNSRERYTILTPK